MVHLTPYLVSVFDVSNIDLTVKIMNDSNNKKENIHAKNRREVFFMHE